MAKTFDTTLKTLIDDHAADWVAYLAGYAGLPVGPAGLLDTDLSVSPQADRLFRVGGPAPYVLHLELESTGRLGIPLELLRYNVPAHGRHDLPVHSVLVLLRPKATATDLTGVLDVAGIDGRPYLTFRYTVVRVWREPFDRLLSAGLGLAPLAMVTDEAATALPEAFDRFVARLHEPDVPVNVAKDLLGSTESLCGLRYDAEQVAALYRSLSMTLEDSSVYQWALSKGVAEGVAQGRMEGAMEKQRTTIFRLGTKRFGPPSSAVRADIEAITDAGRLDRITDRLIDAAGWDDLLATP